MNAAAPASTTEKPEFVPGSWQDTLAKSATLLDRSNKGRAKASALLWAGAQSAIEEWLDNSDVDVYAEVMYATVLDILGKDRKGDASKIKSVALAVKGNGLVLASYPNLSKAYAEATRLTKTVKVQAEEDTAADEATSAIEPPRTATTAEAAAKIVLAKGVDEAVRVLLDVLNGATPELQNTPAHRAFLRAVAQEINGRATAEAQAAKDKAEAERKAKADAAAKAKPAKKAAAKKAPAKKAPAKPKPKPAAKPAPVEDEVAEDLFDVEPDTDMDDLLEGLDEGAGEPEAEAPAPAAKTAKPKPVRRGPVRRG